MQPCHRYGLKLPIQRLFVDSQLSTDLKTGLFISGQNITKGYFLWTYQKKKVAIALLSKQNL
ncbi:MAG: hypothetical protein QNJ72_01360 [Pleurocapsa sp. MO_226.B13]|nr:hypothetical protein [Pleurocapsa sp. MO_226.B13]